MNPTGLGDYENNLLILRFVQFIVGVKKVFATDYLRHIVVSHWSVTSLSSRQLHTSANEVNQV